MKKKWTGAFLAALCVLGILSVLWAAAFTTDYVRCSSLREPLFVVARGVTADDGGSGNYQGLGYTVEVERRVDAVYGPCVSAVTMRVSGKVIAASIA